jgi:hypothetical protein
VTIAGWYATHRSERLLETARRQEKIQDFQTALLADIRSTVHRFQQIDLDSHLSDMVAQIEGAPEGRDYTPFVPPGAGKPAMALDIARGPYSSESGHRSGGAILQPA